MSDINSYFLNALIPGEYVKIFRKRSKKKNISKKSRKDDLKILTLAIGEDMLKKSIPEISTPNLTSSNNSLHEETTIEPSPLVTNIEKTVANKVDKQIAEENKIGEVFITDEETTKNYKFNMIELDGMIQLINNKGELCGDAEDWEDIDDVIDDEFKNNDNIVLKPDGCGENILSFNINRNTQLSHGTYREYRYLEDHFNLQQTNIVTVEYL